MSSVRWATKFKLVRHDHAGIPCVPGSEGNLSDVDEARILANNIGYPVMLKATNGGGGRGIRRCDNEKELLGNYERVISEASKAFGKPEVFLEKCVVNPKHIEVQVLGDSHGNVIHLFERDCSIQRRNQKLIEIAPSPQLTQAQRTYIGNLGAEAARAVGYENAGTVEFLLDQDNNFYFMEMNTRVQVEHTVTESITGIDIVQEQIRIADGLELQYKQKDVSFRGYAMEFRINAEDPKNGFLPSFGKITRLLCAGGGPAYVLMQPCIAVTSSRPTSTPCAPSSLFGRLLGKALSSVVGGR